MSIIRNDYDMGLRVDETWYNSSNAIYSRFEEDKEKNTGDLYVVFKGGKQYLYKSVSYSDYLRFKHGMKEGSTGKALNEYIIKQYPAEKKDDASLEKLLERRDGPAMGADTYYIYGDAYNEEIFQGVYVPAIQYALESDSVKFIGSFKDRYAVESAKFILEAGADPGRVTLIAEYGDDIPESLSESNIIRVDDGEFDNAQCKSFIIQQLLKMSEWDISYITEDKLLEILEVSPTAYASIIRQRM